MNARYVTQRRMRKIIFMEAMWEMMHALFVAGIILFVVVQLVSIQAGYRHV